MPRIVMDDGREIVLVPGDYIAVGAGNVAYRLEPVPYAVLMIDSNGLAVTDFQDPGSWKRVMVEGEQV